MSDVTRILSQIEAGDLSAAEHLLPLVYEELRQLAAKHLAQEKPGQTLQATALVHEAFLRLAGTSAVHPWSSSAHFFSVAAEAMRRILIDNARRKSRMKRGGDFHRQNLDQLTTSIDAPPDEMLALDEALAKLAKVHPDSAELVKLRFFAGLTNEQAAKLLGFSASTADRRWAYARA